jgi:hypothetical protein
MKQTWEFKFESAAEDNWKEHSVEVVIDDEVEGAVMTIDNEPIHMPAKTARDLATILMYVDLPD